MPDIAMTMPSNNEGGDLVQSAPYLDDDGNEVVDFALVSGFDEIIQLVYTLIRTQAPDLSTHPDIGGNLEDLLGLPNNKVTADLGIAKIRAALATSPLLNTMRIDVTAVPADTKSILFVIKINDYKNVYTIPVVFDLKTATQYIPKQVV